MVILCVDDNESVLNFYGEYLTSNGYIVRESLSITKAKRIIDEEKIDLSIIDLVFFDNKESGLDLTNYYKAKYPNGRVILISAHSELLNEIPRKNIDYILEKPFSPAKLLGAIKMLCGSTDIIDNINCKISDIKSTVDEQKGKVDDFIEKNKSMGINIIFWVIGTLITIFGTLVFLFTYYFDKLINIIKS